jgi:pimeloyl-ACP methyl ester carboxylesterase
VTEYKIIDKSIRNQWFRQQNYKKNMINKQRISFKNNINELTSCDIYYNNNIKLEKIPFVLLLHGFRAFSDWGFFPYFATKLAESGFIVGCLDFSLNTLLDKEKQWFDMDRFRKNTVTQMITEARMLIENLKDLLFGSLIDKWNSEVYMFGHSLGGALAIAVADNSLIVKNIVTICSIADIDIYTDRQKERWNILGYKEFVDSNTKQKIILDVEFLRDRLTYIGNKSLSAMVSRLNIPTYFIHTAADATVSPKAVEILSASFSNKKLLKTEIVPKANHLLNCKHPFTATNDALEYIINNVILFYKN